MGKKSRSKAADGRSVADGGGGGAESDDLRSISIGRQKCVRCCSTLKDISKAHPCPGCSALYCWRCERKVFMECPNAKTCVQPTRRCRDCAGGVIMAKNCDAGLVRLGDDATGFDRVTSVIFNERIQQDDRLSVHARPFEFCTSDGCSVNECYLCYFDSSEATTLLRCSICRGNARCSDCFSASYEDLKLCLKRVHREIKFRGIATDNFEMIGGILCEDVSDVLVVCGNATCNFVGCIGCLDDKSMESLIDRIFFNGPVLFECSICYWSSKPCTNSTCPNEPGVPTKRCGGCHIDRYCSVECQAAAYPAHVPRCHKIQAKRAGARKDANEYADAISDAYSRESAAASQKPWY